VDDLHGTIMREKIFHMAGVTTPEEQTVEALRHAIHAAGREPVQRDSFYNHLLPVKRARPLPKPALEADGELVCA
jgi:aminodeoxyfutalosine synthase